MGTLKAELMENESKFHLLHCQLSIADHNIKRVRAQCWVGWGAAYHQGRAPFVLSPWEPPTLPSPLPLQVSDPAADPL